MFARFIAAMAIALVVSGAHALDLYKVSVTRKARNIYQIDGTSIYIKTRDCYGHTRSKHAVLRLDSPDGYNIGELIFVSGRNKCDVEKVL